MKFSIIIVTFNRKKTLVSCLESIKRQNPDMSFEVVVVLNGDLTYLDKYRQQFPNFQFLHIPHTTVAAARNYAIDKAKGEYILFLNEESLLPENYFSNINFNLGWDVLSGPNQAQPMASAIEKSIGRALASPLCMGPAFKRHSKKASYDFRANVDNLNIANLWFKKGLFHEGFEFSRSLYKNEDYYLLIDLAAKNKIFHYNPNLSVYHQRARSLERLCAAIIKSGKCKTHYFFKNPTIEKSIYLFPLLFSSFIFCMLFHPKLWFGVALLSYVGAILLYDLTHYKRLSLRLIVLHFLFQFCFAIGSISGAMAALKDEEMAKFNKNVGAN